MFINDSKCIVCKHKYIGGESLKWVDFGVPSCQAFPNGIPKEIISGKKSHDEPWPEQENDLVFEPIEGYEE